MPQNNPFSLIKLLKLMRTKLSGTKLSQEELADLFAKQARGYAIEHSVGFREISKWERDQVQLAYWQIELYSHLAQMPTGLILVVSRLLADFRDKDFVDMSDIAYKLASLADTLSPLIKKCENESVDEDYFVQILFDAARKTKAS
jgi:hypothetical protein